MSGIVQDLRYALRQLRKSPLSTGAVIIALAFGIGMNTTIFGFVNSLLLRPPAHVEAPDRLLELWGHNRHASGIEAYAPLTYPDYVYYRDRNRSFTGIMAFDGDPEAVIWNKAGEGQVVYGQLVSGNFFNLLGVPAFLGRTLVTEDDQATNPRSVVVLSYSFWQHRFASDPQVVGKTLLLNGVSYSVIGVAPPHFAGMLVAVEPDFWAPLTTVAQITRDKDRLTNRNGYWLISVARLKPGVNARGAQAEASVLARQIEQEHPDTNKDMDATVFPATLVPGPYRGYVGAFTGLLMGVFALVLLIAGANAASLFLARATGRKREIAMRSALGAGRTRLIRQLLVESTLTSFVAGGAGLVLAYWITPLLLALKPSSLPLTVTVPADWRVFAFTGLVAFTVGVVFGLTPALRTTNIPVISALRDDAQFSGQAKSRFRSVLVVGQIAICTVLLVGAALCVRSLRNASSIDPGFDTNHLAVASLDPGRLGYSEAQVQQFYERLSRRIEALPGVMSATYTGHLPLGSAREQTAVTNEIGSTSNQNQIPVDVVRIAPRYFETMGIPVLQGQELRDTDVTRPVAIINEALAQRLWPNQDPVGRPFSGADKVSTEIVGVVKTGKYRTLGEEPIPVIYLPQLPTQRTLIVRTSGDPASILNMIRGAIQDVDPNIAATDLETMQQYMALPLFPARTVGLLLGASGFLALLLTSIGLFGLIFYVVSQRTHEIGIRMALGARPTDVLAMVVGNGLLLTVIGLVLGLCIAFPASHLLSSLLYGISPTDPATFFGVTVLLGLIALSASYLPARRAAKVDPLVALRYE